MTSGSTSSRIRSCSASFGFLTLVLSVTLAAVAAVYVLSRGARLTPRGFVVAPWAKGHLLGLGAAFLVVKAWGYSLDAFGLLFSGGGASFGASYADVNAQAARRST